MERNVPDEVLPWDQRLEQLLEERGVSQEDLAYEARQQGGPKISSSSISKVRRGTRPLHPEFLEAIASALDVAPETFAEYQLALARRAIDESVVGLKRALANLSRLADDGPEEIDAALDRLADEVQERPTRSRKSRGRRDAKGKTQEVA